MKKVIRDLPERNFNELNAAQRYLFGVMPVIGTSDMFTPVIMHMKMPRLPKLMSNKAEREALETTTLTQFVNFLKQKYNLIVEAIEQERRDRIEANHQRLVALRQGGRKDSGTASQTSGSRR